MAWVFVKGWVGATGLRLNCRSSCVEVEDHSGGPGSDSREGYEGSLAQDAPDGGGERGWNQNIF